MGRVRNCLHTGFQGQTGVQAIYRRVAQAVAFGFQGILRSLFARSLRPESCIGKPGTRINILSSEVA